MWGEGSDRFLTQRTSRNMPRGRVQFSTCHIKRDIRNLKCVQASKSGDIRG